MEIVCLQDGDSSTAAYCLPNVAGTVEGYFELAKAIGPGHLMYGIQLADRQQNGKFKEFSSLREMAAAMVPDLLTHHRDGPICLVGFSFAGFLAIELAQQLVGHRRHVPLVVIMARRGPSASFKPLFRIKHFMRHVGPWALKVATRAAANSKYRSIYRNKLRGRHELHGHHKFFVGTKWYESLPKDYQDYITQNDANLQNYRFEGTYRGKILLFRDRLPEPDPHPLRFDLLEDYGWGGATGASINVVYTPDDPASIMHGFDVAHVANALRLALSECNRSLQITKSKSPV